MCVRQKRASSKSEPNKKEEENDAKEEGLGWEEEAVKASNKSVGKAAQRTCAGKEAAPARKTRGGAEGAGGSVSVSAECKECNAK